MAVRKQKTRTSSFVLPSQKRMASRLPLLCPVRLSQSGFATVFGVPRWRSLNMDNGQFRFWSSDPRDWSLSMRSFVNKLRKEVNAIGKRLKVSTHRAFNIWFARIVFDLDEDDAYEASGID